MRDGLSWRNYVIVARRRTSVTSEPFVSPRPSQVHVKVSVPKGIKFVGHPGKHHLTRKKCVPPGEAAPTSIVLSVNELGPANITGHFRFNFLYGSAGVYCLYKSPPDIFTFNS